MHLLYSQLRQSRHKPTQERHKSGWTLKSEQIQLFYFWSIVSIVPTRLSKMNRLRSRTHHAAGIWKRRFHSKWHRTFAVHTALEEFENTTESPGILDLYLRKTRSGKSRDYCDVIIFESSVFKMFSVHTKKKRRRFQIPPAERAFSKSSVGADGRPNRSFKFLRRSVDATRAGSCRRKPTESSSKSVSFSRRIPTLTDWNENTRLVC